MRKSFKLAPGVRMTVTPKGVGVSAGTKGARVSMNSSGRTTRTLGIPGSGISHVKTTGSSKQRSAPQRSAPPAPAAPPVPGLFAPKWEKQLHQALIAKPNVDDLRRVAQEFEQAQPLAAIYEAVRGALPQRNITRAIDLLSFVSTSGYDPAQDPFVRKYLPFEALPLEIADGIAVELPLDRDTVGLLLAESLQSASRLHEAIDVVEKLTPSTYAAVSLAELYAAEERWPEIVELTEGLSNDDEAATFLLIQRGIALREQGFAGAAREALKEALRVRSRPAELRQRALVERGITYLAEGKKSMARKDLEKVLAEDSRYPGLKELLDQLDG